MYLLTTLSVIALTIICGRIYLIIRSQNKRKQIGYELIANKYELRKKTIRFGSKLYQRLSKQNPFYHFIGNLFDDSPVTGISYTVEYIDTKPDNSHNESNERNEHIDTKIILALHGTPGNIGHWSQFLQTFGDNYRVIVPNFPDFSFTLQTESFWHSNDERVCFLSSFLHSLNITEIDCAVCHSGSNPVILKMICDANSDDNNDDNNDAHCDIIVKSLVMITPPGPKWLSIGQLTHARRLVSIVRTKWKRYLFLFLWPNWLSKYVGVPNTIVDNTDKNDMFLMSFVCVLSGFENNMKTWLECLAHRKVRTLFVMAEKDGLFPKRRYFDILNILTVKDENYSIIDWSNEYESHAKSDEWIRVLNYRNAGHFCFIKYSQIFHNEFKNFFHSVIKIEK